MEDNQINIYRTDIMRYLIENGMKPDVAGNLVFQCITTQGDLLVLSSVLTSGYKWGQNKIEELRQAYC